MRTFLHIVAILPAALTVGCRCNPAPVATPVVVVDHYAGWDRLVRAAADGRLEDAKGVGAQLAGGALVDDSEHGDSASEVGAALGFLRFAETSEEVARSVAAAAAGCGSCHGASGVAPPPKTPQWAHHTAAEHVVFGLVFNTFTAPAAGGAPPLDGIAEAYRSEVPTGTTTDDRVVRTARVLTACAECHAKGD